MHFLKRSIIKITGANTTVVSQFLQGLITNDINLLSSQDNVIYTCFLNNKGRYLYDFFIVLHNDSYYIDIASEDTDSFIKKLNFYKLLTKINIEHIPNLKIVTFKNMYDLTKIDPSIIVYHDPRHKDLPYRKIVTSDKLLENTLTIDEYNNIRYSLSIPEASEFIKDYSIPLVMGMDELNAISYSKGCYVGQEFTHSTKHRMVIRKRVSSFLNISNIVVNIGDSLYVKDDKIGSVIGVHNNYIMAIINIENKDNIITCNNSVLQILFPQWVFM